MTKRVLDVGNCDLDYTSISELMRDQFAAEVYRAHGKADALMALQRKKFDLVTVNRVLDRDGSLGLDIIKALKDDPILAEIPVMLITNFPEQQQTAYEAGAVPGFGKAALQSSETIELLKPYLFA